MICNYNYKVRVGDINYGGHMSNDRALLIFHEARIDFLQKHDMTEFDIGDGLGVILGEAYIKYKKEVFMGEELIVETKLDKYEGLRWYLHYSCKRIADNQEVFSGYTTMLCFDYEKKKTARIPDGFIEKLLS